MPLVCAVYPDASAEEALANPPEGAEGSYEIPEEMRALSGHVEGLALPDGMSRGAVGLSMPLDAKDDVRANPNPRPLDAA